MPGILVREVELETLEKLKKRAKKNGRSLQSEVRSIIIDVVEGSSLSDEETASAIKQSLRGREFSDSAELLREDRYR
jgi:plasmid stability protein